LILANTKTSSANANSEEAQTITTSQPTTKKRKKKEEKDKNGRKKTMKRAATSAGKSSNTIIKNNLSGIDIIAANDRIQQKENLERLHENKDARLYRRKSGCLLFSFHT